MSAQEFDAIGTSPTEVASDYNIPSSALTYSVVMSHTAYLQRAKVMPYTGYPAMLYAKWFPYIVLAPILAAFGIIASLSLPWLSIGVNSTPITGFQIATNGVPLLNLFLSVPSLSFSLWAEVILALALIVWSVFLLWSKVVTTSLILSLQLCFGLLVLFDVVYLCISAFGHSDKLAIGPSYGPWVSVVGTVIASIIFSFFLLELRWYWILSQEGVKQMTRRTKGFSIPPEFFR